MAKIVAAAAETLAAATAEAIAAAVEALAAVAKTNQTMENNRYHAVLTTRGLQQPPPQHAICPRMRVFVSAHSSSQLNSRQPILKKYTIAAVSAEDNQYHNTATTRVTASKHDDT